ncbi:MAG: hypothetical protein AB7O95_13135 [Geminicoccaceae bacterium]
MALVAHGAARGDCHSRVRLQIAVEADDRCDASGSLAALKPLIDITEDDYGKMPDLWRA